MQTPVIHMRPGYHGIRRYYSITFGKSDFQRLTTGAAELLRENGARDCNGSCRFDWCNGVDRKGLAV